jgi:predicted anti-sigma-YlaC factor YlaD
MSSSFVDASPIAPLDCEQTARWLWDHLDAELTPAQHAAVEQHLAQCPECTAHFVFEERFLRALSVSLPIDDAVVSPFVQHAYTSVTQSLQAAGVLPATYEQP